MMNRFETPTQHKQLITVGRKMMDYSEEFGKIHGLKHLKDGGLRILNELSHVGGMLTRFGVTFGTGQNDFTEADQQLIAKFVRGDITAEYIAEAK